MSEVLSAADILGARDLAVVEELVPEWPGKDGEPGMVRLRQLPAEDVMLLTAELDKAKGDGMYVILVYCAVAADGASAVFTMADVPALKRKSFAVLDRLQRAALRVNGMEPGRQAALKKD